MKVQAVPFPIHPPNQHISVNHQPGCGQPHRLFSLWRCNAVKGLFWNHRLSQFSFVQLDQNQIKVELTKISQKNPFHVREVCCSTLVTCKVPDFLNRIMYCLAADYITFLNSQSSTSPHPVTRSFGREAAAATLISFLCW